MEDQVPEEVKKERFQRLLETQNRISKEINDTFLGKVVEVLVEVSARQMIRFLQEGQGETKLLILRLMQV